MTIRLSLRAAGSGLATRRACKDRRLPLWLASIVMHVAPSRQPTGVRGSGRSIPATSYGRGAIVGQRSVQP
jgi:hypothetical protein